MGACQAGGRVARARIHSHLPTHTPTHTHRLQENIRKNLCAMLQAHPSVINIKVRLCCRVIVRAGGVRIMFIVRCPAVMTASG